MWMEDSIFTRIEVVLFLICKVFSNEEYILLPENSAYCSEYPSFRRFSLSRQMSFTSGIYNESWNHLIYVCKVRVHPNGRMLQYNYPKGQTSFWFHRLKIDIQFGSCEDVLIIGFIPEKFLQIGLNEEIVNFTCHDTYPKIIESRHRIVSLVWHTKTGSTEEISSVLDVQMSAYMRFEGSFGISDKIQRCESGSGFWCGNQTAVCIHGQMRCDQADGCFDGGTDEAGCPPPRNYTSLPEPNRLSLWPSFLPWTALCLIPLILIFVLGLICTPRKTALEDLEEGDHMAAVCKRDARWVCNSSVCDHSDCGSIRSTRSAVYCSDPINSLKPRILRSYSNPVLSAELPSRLDFCPECYLDRVNTLDLPPKPRKCANSAGQKAVSFHVPCAANVRNHAASQKHSKLDHHGYHRLARSSPKHADEQPCIPAEFEMAALNIRRNVGALVNTRAILTGSNLSYSSDESDHEDVAPFRRPDPVGRDLFQVEKDASLVNGALCTTTLSENTTVAHVASGN